MLIQLRGDSRCSSSENQYRPQAGPCRIRYLGPVDLPDRRPEGIACIDRALECRRTGGGRRASHQLLHGFFKAEVVYFDDLGTLDRWGMPRLLARLAVTALTTS